GWSAGSRCRDRRRGSSRERRPRRGCRSRGTVPGRGRCVRRAGSGLSGGRRGAVTPPARRRSPPRRRRGRGAGRAVPRRRSRSRTRGPRAGVSYARSARGAASARPPCCARGPGVQDASLGARWPEHCKEAGAGVGWREEPSRARRAGWRGTLPGVDCVMVPLTAITATIVPEAGVYRRPEIALYAVYVSVLERQGLAAVMLTPAHSRRSCEELLRRCHGLVLSGGEDLDPARYGERALPRLGTVNPARDEMEFAALEIALERRIPVLGICRGLQLLNVFFGGTLYQDVGTQYPGALRHVQEEAWGLHSHEARIVESSRLAAIVGSTRIRINSFHHQAIKD